VASQHRRGADRVDQQPPSLPSQAAAAEAYWREFSRRKNICAEQQIHSTARRSTGGAETRGDSAAADVEPYRELSDREQNGRTPRRSRRAPRQRQPGIL
jgi:hypothetical protein